MFINVKSLSAQVLFLVFLTRHDVMVDKNYIADLDYSVCIRSTEQKHTYFQMLSYKYCISNWISLELHFPLRW